MTVDPIKAEGARFEQRRVVVDDGVALNTMIWTPDRPLTDAPLVFVAGWVSVVQGWAHLLRGLAATRPVYYIESREKASADIDRPSLHVEDFSIERSAEDLINACGELDLDMTTAMLVASSLGATIVMEALKHGRLKARKVFLIAPASQFKLPGWGRPFLRLPDATYPVIQHVVLSYLRYVKVDVKNEPEQMERYERTVRSAHPGRLKRSARAVIDYTVWPDLGTVLSDVAVTYAPTDTLHSSGDIHAIEVQCPSNLYMHRADLIADLDRFEGR